MPKKLVLAVIDALKPEMLDQAVAEGQAPALAALLTAYADGAALLLAAIAIFVPPLGYLAIPGFVLLLLAGRRREGEKYAGLRILR